MFRVIGSWGERHVFLFRRAFIIAKKRKDGFLQVKVIIKVLLITIFLGSHDFWALGSLAINCCFIPVLRTCLSSVL